MRLNIFTPAALLATLLLPSAAAAKTASTIYTPERVATARDNIARYDWARAERDKVLAYASKWIAFTHDQIWNLPVEQTVPRTVYVEKNLGCPIHGKDLIDKFGVYGWKVDAYNHPWKVQCPIGGERWPTNDFGKFYASGKNAQHVFQYSLANRSLLTSADPNRSYGVDDGTGYVDSAGNRYAFVAYYAHWGVWQQIGRSWSQALVNLSEAYAMTGDKAYARKAAILLSRIADLLPTMDTNYWSTRGYNQGDGNSHRGLMLGAIWDSPVASALARSYDAIWPAIQNDPELYSFLHGKAVQYGLTPVDTPAKLAAHIEKNILNVLLPAIQVRRIRANEGVHQRAYAEAAIALDNLTATPQWLDWLNQPGTMYDGGGHLPTIFTDWIDRDGVTDEASPSYSWHWLEAIQPLADLLQDSPYATSYSLTQYPNFRNFLSFPFRMQLLPNYYPHIGDDGSTGQPGIASGSDPKRFAAAFSRYGYPELAQMAYALNGNRTSGLHGSIWDPGADETASEILRAVQLHGEIKRYQPQMLSGYGLASMTAKSGTHPAAIWMYTGRQNKHGHWDRLNLGMFAYGLDLMPDLGYPDFPNTDSRNYWGWQNNTVSHNTVVINAKRQLTIPADSTRAFLTDTPIQMVEADGNGVYAETSMYRRTLVRIPTTQGFYLVDLFRVQGGSDHLYSFHAGPGGVTPINLTLNLQSGGTYAGANISFGEFYDGVCCTKYMGSGFSFFDSVYRDNAPPDRFQLEWKVTDNWNVLSTPQDTRLKVWTLSDRATSVAVVRGIPPQNRPGNPQSLRYLLERRQGAAPLTTHFVHLFEPHLNNAEVLSVERFTPEPALDESGFQRIGLRIELTDGRVDTLVHSLAPGNIAAAARAGETFSFSGRAALVRAQHGVVTGSHLVAGSKLELADTRTLLGEGAWTGTVQSVNTTNPNQVRLIVSPPAPAGAWTGRYIRVLRPGGHNPFYQIQNISNGSEDAIVSLGRVNLVRGHAQLSDYTKGFLRDLLPGDKFEIVSDAYGIPQLPAAPEVPPEVPPEVQEPLDPEEQLPPDGEEQLPPDPEEDLESPADPEESTDPGAPTASLLHKVGNVDARSWLRLASCNSSGPAGNGGGAVLLLLGVAWMRWKRHAESRRA